MSTWEHNCVFDSLEADNTGSLRVIRSTRLPAVFTVHVCQLKNRAVVEQLLLQQLKSELFL